MARSMQILLFLAAAAMFAAVSCADDELPEIVDNRVISDEDDKVEARMGQTTTFLSSTTTETPHPPTTATPTLAPTPTPAPDSSTDAPIPHAPISVESDTTTPPPTTSPPKPNIMLRFVSTILEVPVAVLQFIRHEFNKMLITVPDGDSVH